MGFNTIGIDIKMPYLNFGFMEKKNKVFQNTTTNVISLMAFMKKISTFY
jgi:hypothetical protein